MAPKNNKIIQCPVCVSKCINHRVFQSTRVADYANQRFIRYFRCAPSEKDTPHVEHEWPVADIRPGTNMKYPELGDECFLELTKYGRPELHVIAKEVEE